MARWPFELEQFDYHRFIEDYFRRFGENRVLVLPFELLRHDGSDFVWRLVRFAGARAEESVVDDLPFGVRVNQANGSVYVAARRRLNLIMRDRLTPGGVSTGEAERA